MSRKHITNVEGAHDAAGSESLLGVAQVLQIPVCDLANVHFDKEVRNGQ